MDKAIKWEHELIDLYVDKSDVTGIFLSGSLADDSFDEYSDVDLRIIIDTDDINLYVSNEKTILSNKESVLFFEPCPYFQNCIIVHFDSFIKADIFFYTREMLLPSIWHKNIKIIKDTDGFLMFLKQASENIEFYINENQVVDQIYKFIALSHECYRRIKRNELLYANYLLTKMK